MSFDIRIYEFGTYPRLHCNSGAVNFIQVIVNEENAHDTQEFITKRLLAIKNQRSTGELEDLALIIGQRSLVPNEPTLFINF
jgi:hypothetical protein